MHPILEKIKELEEEALLLEPGAHERAYNRKRVVEYTEDFLDHIEHIPAYVEEEEKGRGIYDLPLEEEGKPIGRIIRTLKKNVDTPGLNPASGGHLGYIPGGGIFYSALGDYMADVFNRYAGVFFASPGAVRMENMLIDWMGKMIGYKENFTGNITSGGSIANLIGIVTARDAKKVSGLNIEKSIIYASEQMHHCLHKAIRIAGLKDAIVRNIPLDDHFRILPEELEKQIQADKKEGLKPFLIIASAGTTDTGAVDPLDSIGTIAAQHDLWYHVDGAYGAFFILADEVKDKLKGIEKADSVVMDPHKGLFLPYGIGVVLVKNKKLLHESHQYQANYMQDSLSAVEELSPAELSPELTKHFRGLRLWLPLQLMGLRPFRACLKEKIWLTRYFYEEIQKIDGFKVGPYPELSVCFFWYEPKKRNTDAFNKMLVEEIRKDGRVFLSSTLINGKFVIRLAVLSFRTHLSTIELALNLLKEKSEQLERSS